MRRAAALTAELAAQSEKKTAAVCDQPPGLDELAGHIEALNMGAGGSHSHATMMPDPWATYRCPSVSQAKPWSPVLFQPVRVSPTALESPEKGDRDRTREPKTTSACWKKY